VITPALENQLMIWMIAMIRPGAAFIAAPIFGGPNVPVQLRLVIALAIGIPAASMAEVMLPTDGMLSLAGTILVISEVTLGLALGFAVHIGFAAALLGGEVISNAMGLGFASMTDPVGGQSSPAIGQFLSVLATFLLLATDGHLRLAAIIVESFRALPPGGAALATETISGVAKFGGLIFAAGLSIALPVGFSMVLIQIIMGMIARSAPSLNLFAVGLPATLFVGIILLVLATPTLSGSIKSAIDEGFTLARHVSHV
jgi:flagellar biosynthesis protein FliR